MMSYTIVSGADFSMQGDSVFQSDLNALKFRGEKK
jgi:hypothetical protein